MVIASSVPWRNGLQQISVQAVSSGQFAEDLRGTNQALSFLLLKTPFFLVDSGIRAHTVEVLRITVCFPAPGPSLENQNTPSSARNRSSLAAMAQYYPHQQPYAAAQASTQNLQFFPSSYASVSGHTTPSQAAYGGFGAGSGQPAPAYPGAGYGGFASSSAGVSGRMGEQGGLRTGWLAAFGTEGYDGEPPLLEELGVNFEHIRMKVGKNEEEKNIHPPTTVFSADSPL